MIPLQRLHGEGGGVNGVKLPHFLIWCFAGAADRRPSIALPGVPTARIMPARRDGLMQQSPSLGGVGDVRVIAARMGY